MTPTPAMRSALRRATKHGIIREARLAVRQALIRQGLAEERQHPEEPKRGRCLMITAAGAAVVAEGHVD